MPAEAAQMPANILRQTWSMFDFFAIYGPFLLNLLTFQRLVANPVNTLSLTLPAVLLMTLLPSLLRSNINAVSTVHAMGLLLLYFLPGTYTLVVIMGAPFTTHIAQTVLFSAHLAIMTFYTAITFFGQHVHNWIPLVPFIEDESSPQEADKRVGGTGIEGIVWGTLAGAYIGAVPIPLDWDREWQKWPVTVHTGACLGLALGGTLQLLYNAIVKPSERANASKAKKST